MQSKFDDFKVDDINDAISAVSAYLSSPTQAQKVLCNCPSCWQYVEPLLLRID